MRLKIAEEPAGFRAALVPLAQPGAPRHQHPVDELLAEHALTLPLLLAMESEANKLAHRRHLRLHVWELIVELMGNFLHHCHRRKEDDALFSATNHVTT